ncbi:MAG: hypothetical protein HY517_03085 [Candidatus Aenigmarchaeota archaeon]|nr:hypothetical protein [Candidatus Aenigmarchaeota archaeon]
MPAPFMFMELPVKTATRKAYEEMAQFRMDFSSIVSVLNEGYDCGMKRREGIVERCAPRKLGTIKVVVERIVSESGIPYWRVRHVGIVGR